MEYACQGDEYGLSTIQADGNFSEDLYSKPLKIAEHPCANDLAACTAPETTSLPLILTLPRILAYLPRGRSRWPHSLYVGLHLNEARFYVCNSEGHENPYHFLVDNNNPTVDLKAQIAVSSTQLQETDKDLCFKCSMVEISDAHFLQCLIHRTDEPTQLRLVSCTGPLGAHGQGPP
jgi:hypothetical protein